MRKKGRLCIGIVLILMLGLSLPCFMCSAKIKPKEQMYGWVNNNKNTIQLNKKATDSMIGKTSKQKLKNASDVSALKKLIRKQRKRGATVPVNIDARCYKWNDKGRLIGIAWIEDKLKGRISFSKFSCLETLEIYMNRLTGLDVSGNKKLKYINCEYNQLTSLNVSHNTNLEQLYCEENKLTKLNCSQNKKLKVLVCSCNKLTSLDIRNNLDLDCLGCEENR